MTRLIAALAALLALAACHGAPSAGGGEVLRVGSQKGGVKSIMLASGALAGAPYTVEWSEFPAAQHLLEAIGSNAVDTGLAGDAPFIFAFESGSPIKAVGAQTRGRYPAAALSILVPGASPVRSLIDLKGKKVATTRGSIGHYLVIRALSVAHLPPDWVTLVFLAPGDAKAAFSSGAIDAWATWVPYASAALKDGARVVVDAPGLVSGYGFDVANDQAIASRRAILADFLQREARALLWANAHPQAFATVLAKETGLPQDIALDFAAKYKLHAVPIDASVVDAQRVVLGEFSKAGILKSDRDLGGAFVDLSK